MCAMGMQRDRRIGRMVRRAYGPRWFSGQIVYPSTTTVPVIHGWGVQK